MNGPVTLSEVRDFLIAREFHPSRALGQNFLVDRNILALIVRHAGIAAGDHVLEIGPGLGALTALLLAEGARVTAIEKDHRLCGYLREIFAGQSALKLIEGDALDEDLPTLLAGGIGTVVANLPYSTGSRMLVDLCEAKAAPARLCVTVQQEVADRLTARPGGRQSGVLTVRCGCRYDIRQVHTVSSGCFWPRPTVGSAVLVMERKRPALDPAAATRYQALTDFAFKRRRKQLAATLASAPPPVHIPAAACRDWLIAAGLPPTARPEDLSPAQWRALAANG